MPIKFLCIDDEKTRSPESYLNLISQKTDGGILTFERKHPKDLGNQIDEIEKFVASHLGQCGLILDLRLDRDPDEKGQSVPYRGSTLAQELRTRMAEGTLPSFPIVLWTVDERFKQSYEVDDTAHDLFDRVYLKDVEVNKKPNVIGQELISLVEGYSLITNAKKSPIDLVSILGLNAGEVNNLDPRILENFYSSEVARSVHEYSRFMLSDLIGCEGVLIDERVLAARMGIDIQRSKEDWITFKEVIKSTAYKGAFNSAWPRWWAHLIEAWCIDNKFQPRRLSAGQRVEFLNKLCKLQLVAAEPIDKGYSTSYWTICQVYEAPLDSVNGLRASCPALKPWQNTPYLSIKAVLNRAGRDKWRVHPMEVDRLESLKSSEEKK